MPSIKAQAREAGVPETTFRRHLKRDKAVQEAMDHIGTDLTPGQIWYKSKNFSIRLSPTPIDPMNIIRAALDELRGDVYPIYPPRPPVSGTNLLVIDLADIHVGKLCIETETGNCYNRDIAIHRMVEGARELMDMGRAHQVGRAVLVLGNDILHVDNRIGTTTNGTEQDTDGSVHQMYSAALAGYVRVAEMLSAEVDVDLVFVPSNHDRVMGWALAGAVALALQNNPRVHATDYNLSERPRKYYRFGENLIGISHGDGEKDGDLFALMMTEARAHISECARRYWYRHHLHHKIKKRGGVVQEKDHIGMTVMALGGSGPEDLDIEYIRSPSPADGWHYWKGYMNRQAVECFVHHPHAGQIARFTSWF